jgi:hypothetical protein
MSVNPPPPHLFNIICRPHAKALVHLGLGQNVEQRVQNDNDITQLWSFSLVPGRTDTFRIHPTDNQGQADKTLALDVETPIVVQSSVFMNGNDLGRPSQEWTVTRIASPPYFFQLTPHAYDAVVANANILVLDLLNSDEADNAGIVVWDNLGHEDQHWALVPSLMYLGSP